MEDEWMFQALGAMGARLERDEPEGEGGLVLRFLFPPDGQQDRELLISALEQSPDVSKSGDDEEAADIVEERLSRHFTVKRIDEPQARGVVREWALSERSASPGLDQPVT